MEVSNCRNLINTVTLYRQRQTDSVGLIKLASYCSAASTSLMLGFWLRTEIYARSRAQSSFPPQERKSFAYPSSVSFPCYH